jgi:hypothetical protein
MGDRGSSRWAAYLTDVIPVGPIGDDDHRHVLIERLDRLATVDEIDADLRAEAARLAAGGRDLPELIGRRGRAFIIWWEDHAWTRWPNTEQQPAAYFCSWQGDGDNDLYEDGPLLADLDEALAWGRARTDLITVRPSWDPATHYWAGDGPTMPGEPELVRPS